MKITNRHKITPVEKHGDYWFKRDDSYSPFDVPLNGGKVRQAMSCIERNEKEIRESCNGIVATVTSVHSPQGYLIAKCAAAFGFKTVIGLGTGAVEKAIENNAPLKAAKETLGAEYVSLARIGYNSILQNRLNALCQQKGYFPIHFGIPFDLSENAAQVKNIPAADNLVIPCGSGITAAAILKGLSERPARERPANVYVVQIAGIDRRKVIRPPMNYAFVKDTTYPYSKNLPLTYEGVELDGVYEAKAFAWMQRSGMRGSTVFWVIGNFNHIRKGTP